MFKIPHGHGTTISLETKCFIWMSTPLFGTYRWHFMKCRSNIIEMNKHKTHAPSTNPGKKNRNYLSQWEGWVLTILGFVIFSNSKGFNIYINHTKKIGIIIQQLAHLPHTYLVPVLLGCWFPRLGNPGCTNKHYRIRCTFLTSVKVAQMQLGGAMSRENKNDLKLEQ